MCHLFSNASAVYRHRDKNVRQDGGTTREGQRKRAQGAEVEHREVPPTGTVFDRQTLVAGAGLLMRRAGVAVGVEQFGDSGLDGGAVLT